MKTRSLLVALALPLALVTACGDDTTSTASDPASTTSASTPTSTPSSEVPSASPSEAQPKSPQCDDIWVEGDKLPGPYQGCFKDQKRVPPDGRYCEFGKPLYTYANTFYAVPNGTIAKAKQPFAQDVDYQDTLAKCSG